MIVNRLSQETSPYLLQHQHNPVHWYPWSEEAFADAKRLDRPILLSIGYAACHWCHVMAHESFEDQATARLLNDGFVSIKLDREERPDIDRIYMQALQALGEQGGWPLTMFLTPDREPFWGGTYFPPEPRYGRPSFTQVLIQISRIWQHERHKISQNTQAIMTALRQMPAGAQDRIPTAMELSAQTQTILRAIDMQAGGIKGAPKFPQAPVFSFLWEAHLRSHEPLSAEALTTTLQAMSQGGIYDHLGGGLARYATDAQWLVPHFEKMLYDNAQFVGMLARAFLRQANPLYRQRAEETVAFMLEDMRSSEGCFTTSFDADSEGEEGKYYVWTEAEIRSALDSDTADLFCAAYDVTPRGNWEGKTILNRSSHPALSDAATEVRLAAARQILLAIRRKREPPAHDDKVLTDWNGIAIAALAEAAFAFRQPAWLNAAAQAFDRLLALMWRDGQLFHSHRAGRTQHLAMSDDYAALIHAGLTLHGLTARARLLDAAQSLVKSFEISHWDEAGGFFQTAKTGADVPVRLKTADDDVMPSANALMVGSYGRLYHSTGEQGHMDRARSVISAFSASAMRNPFSAPALLKAVYQHTDPLQLVLVSDTNAAASPLLARAVAVTGLDCAILMIRADQPLPPSHPAAGKQSIDGRATLYICRGQTCASPATTTEEVDAALDLLGLKIPG
jgi:uncharacterized protein